MKIAVYTIALNEEKFVRRFCESCKDADYIIIADTGSTDRTVELAREYGAIVYNISVRPWRFDKARDTALALVPADADVCISLDLDEILVENWRQDIEKAWTPETTRLRYQYQWAEDKIFYYTKIHSRYGYYWHHPCHEYIRPDSRHKEVEGNIDKLLVVHQPDQTKPRTQYLDLLELSIKEDPTCSRNAFYYARELTFWNKWDDAYSALISYLDMENGWNVERSYAMRLLGRYFYLHKENPQQAEYWLYRAIAECNNQREPWYELAKFLYSAGRWDECLYACKKVMSLPKTLDYTVDPETWSFNLYDIAALAAWNTEQFPLAIEYGKIAVNTNPDDERLKSNLRYYFLADTSELE